jgi:inosose dehydratase
MTARLASAPVTWGVWERTVDLPDLIPPDRMLEAVSELGYTGIELGPPGYFETEAFGAYGLQLVGGFAPLHLADEDAFRDDLAAWLDPVIDVILATGRAGPVVLADAETDERLAGPTPLPPDEFARALERANAAVERCRSRGVPVVFHHHTATYVETPDEIERFLAGTDVGICFDTGHAVVGGGTVEGVARLCGGRIEHLHLKDVDGAMLERVRSGEVTLEQAWNDGLFCPFGEGVVDFRSVLALPELAGFTGWMVIEQDRVAVGADDLGGVRAVEERNLAVVREAL